MMKIGINEARAIISAMHGLVQRAEKAREKHIDVTAETIGVKSVDVVVDYAVQVSPPSKPDPVGKKDEKDEPKAPPPKK
jgi:hypothetical protein